MTYCLPLLKYVSLYRSHNLTSVFTKIQLSFKSHDAGTKLNIVFYILLLSNQQIEILVSLLTRLNTAMGFQEITDLKRNNMHQCDLKICR